MGDSQVMPRSQLDDGPVVRFFNHTINVWQVLLTLAATVLATVALVHQDEPTLPAGTSAVVLLNAPLRVEAGAVASPDQPLIRQVAAELGREADELGSVILNVTARSASEQGWTTVYAADMPNPGTATFVQVPGAPVSNLVFVTVGQAGVSNIGAVVIQPSAGTVEYVVDIIGYSVRA